MRFYSRFFVAPGLAFACLLAPLCPSTLAAVAETPLDGPYKNPFSWPTFWTVEWAQRTREVVPSAAPEKDPAKWRETRVEIFNPQTERFYERLGKLTPNSVIQAMQPMAEPAPVLVTEPDPTRYHRFIKSDLITHAPSLSPLQGGQLRNGECRVSYQRSNQSEIVQPFDKITLTKGQADGVKIGDLYHLYEVGPAGYAYSSTQSLGHQIIPNGIAQIVAVHQNSSAARLILCYGKVSRKTMASPLVQSDERFPVNSYIAISGAKPKARVVWIPNSGQLPQPFNYAIIDNGVEAGFRLGDHVLLLNQKSGKMTDRLLGEGLIVHVESKSATIMVHDVYPGIINTGDYALAVQTPQQ